MWMWLVVVVGALALGACSFVFVNGPPDTLPVEGPVDCTTTHGAVFVDGALAVVDIGVSASILLNTSYRGEFDGLVPYLLTPVIIMGALHAISAITGYQDVSACVRANEEVANRPPKSPTPLGATSGMF